MKQKNTFVYNENKDLLSVSVMDGNITYKYLYYKRKEELTQRRKVYIVSTKNKTNFKTIIKQAKIFEKWMSISTLEIGEKFIIYSHYDNNQDVIFSRRFNIKKKTFLTKEIIQKTKHGSVWILNYNGKKNIGFKVNISK